MHIIIYVFIFVCMFANILTFKLACMFANILTFTFSCMLEIMNEQQQLDLLKKRAGVPRDISKKALWDLLQQQQARLEAQEDARINFATRVPRSVATGIRRSAHMQGRKVQDVVEEALNLYLAAQED